MIHHRSWEIFSLTTLKQVPTEKREFNHRLAHNYSFTKRKIKISLEFLLHLLSVLYLFSLNILLIIILVFRLLILIFGESLSFSNFHFGQVIIILESHAFIFNIFSSAILFLKTLFLWIYPSMPFLNCRNLILPTNEKPID